MSAAHLQVLRYANLVRSGDTNAELTLTAVCSAARILISQAFPLSQTQRKIPFTRGVTNAGAALPVLAAYGERLLH